MPLLYKLTTKIQFAERAFRCTAPFVWYSRDSHIVDSCSLMFLNLDSKTFLFRQAFTFSVSPVLDKYSAVITKLSKRRPTSKPNP